MSSNFKIGLTLVGLTALDALTPAVPDPRTEYSDWRESVALGSGGVRGTGRPMVMWQWTYLTQAQYNVLKTFCTGASAAVYIRTRKNDGNYASYSAQMLAPQSVTVQAGRVLDVEFRFQFLV